MLKLGCPSVEERGAETQSVRRDAPAQQPYHQRRGVHAQSESHVHASAGMYGPTPREKRRGVHAVRGQPKVLNSPPCVCAHATHH